MRRGALLCAVFACSAAGAARASAPPLWLYLDHMLEHATSVADVDALLDRAAAAGYSAAVLSDPNINLIGTRYEPPALVANIRAIEAHAAALHMTVVPQIFNFGHSDAMLRIDPNLAEGLPVVGARFRVANDKSHLIFQPSTPALANGGFESHSGDRISGWTSQDQPGARTHWDGSSAHSGRASLRVSAGRGNGRIGVVMKVIPYREYHLGFWLKTASFGGRFDALANDAATGRQRTFFGPFAVPATQSWHRYDFVFDSMDSTSLSFFIGVWGTSTGTLQLDDVVLEETAPVNLIRRQGAPIKLYSIDTQPYIEGRDFAPLSDPALAPGNHIPTWHAPLAVALPAGTSLSAGQSVALDYYFASPVAGSVTACLSDPAMFQRLAALMAALPAVFPPETPLLLNYQEIREADTCGSCAAQGLSAGNLLDWNLSQAVAIVRAQRPDAQLYIWSDMFDPVHNAVPDYFLAGGNFGGSWSALPEDLTFMTWNPRRLKDSLAFLSGLGHSQIVAGYYDIGPAAAAAASDAAAAAGVPGIAGFMYTTWKYDYSGLEEYARGIREASPQ